MQADLVDRYLSGIHRVFEHLSEKNHKRSKFEEGRREQRRSAQLAIESAQQAIDQRSAEFGVIRGAVKKAVESIPAHRNPGDSNPVGRDRSGDEEVDTEMAEARLISHMEALERLVAKASERQTFFIRRRSEIQQSLDLVNSHCDKEVHALNVMKSRILARFPADVARKAATGDQKSGLHIEVMSVAQFRELVSQIELEVPSPESINRRVKKGEARSSLVWCGLAALGIPVSIGWYFGGRFVNPPNNIDGMWWYQEIYPFFFWIGVIGTVLFPFALLKWFKFSDS